jgi:hypothetical protein
LIYFRNSEAWSTGLTIWAVMSRFMSPTPGRPTAPVMLVHGFPQNWWGVTVVGHSLGGGVAMQFA